MRMSAIVELVEGRRKIKELEDENKALHDLIDALEDEIFKLVCFLRKYEESDDEDLEELDVDDLFRYRS